MGGDEVASKLNEVFRPVGIGAYHGAVEVYGREWSFGWSDDGTGVFSAEPGGCPCHTYREAIALGTTTLTRREVAQLLRQLEWPGLEYDLLRHNCCHWCGEFCRRLGSEPVPPWLNGLASEVVRLDDGVRDVASTAQAAVDNARRKTEEFNEKIRETVEAKAEEIRGQAVHLRDTVEAKADELKEHAEAAWRDWQTKAEELDSKLGLSHSLKAAGEDLARQRDSLHAALDGLRHRSPSYSSSGPLVGGGDGGDGGGHRQSLLENFRQGVLPFREFGSERPLEHPPEGDASGTWPARQTSLPRVLSG